MHSKTNLGTGTNDGGGSPGNSAGDRVAFGCTEDELCAGGSGTMGVGIFGRAERGSPSDGPFRHEGERANTGWVAGRKGCYHDGNNVKKNEVYALISNPHGGVTRGVERLVLSAHKDKAYDTTRYGEFSTHSFYSHHATQISLAIVTSDAEAINSQLSSDESRFAHTGAVGGR